MQYVNINENTNLRSSLILTPLVTRSILIILLIFYIIGFRNSKLIDKLIDIPYYTYGELQLYRVISTNLFGLDFPNLLITLYLFVYSATRIERHFGSSHLLSTILLLCIAITIFHDGLSMFAYTITNDSVYLFQCNYGFLGVSIALYNISTLMLKVERDTQLCCFGCPNFFRPIVVVLIVYVFDSRFAYSSVSSLVVSYMYFSSVPFVVIKSLSERLAASFDTNSLLVSLLWIPTATSGSAAMSSPSAPGLTDENYIRLLDNSNNPYTYYESMYHLQHTDATRGQTNVELGFRRQTQGFPDVIPIAVPIISYFDDILLDLGSDVYKLPWNAILNQLEYRLSSSSLPSLKDLRTECVFCKSGEGGSNAKNILFAISTVVNEYALYSDSYKVSSVVRAIETSTLDVTSEYFSEHPVDNLRRTLCGLKRQPYQLRYEASDSPTSCVINKKLSTGWGQRKLVMMEICFLSRYASPGDLVVYAGAAPGIHIPYLAGTLFPFLSFELYDPGIFAFDASDCERKNVIIHNDFFRDTSVESYNSHISTGDRSRILFISDIRRLQHDESIVAEDLEMQSKWCRQLKAKAAMLKFRLPYGPGKTIYLNGKILLQPYIGPRSTEARLLVTPVSSSGSSPIEATEYEVKEYDNLEYEEQFCYFNTNIRPLPLAHTVMRGLTSQSYSVKSHQGGTPTSISEPLTPMERNSDLKAAGDTALFFPPRLQYSHFNGNFCIVKSCVESEARMFLTCTGLAPTWDSAVEIDIWKEYLSYVSAHKEAFAGFVNITSAGNLEGISLLFGQNVHDGTEAALKRRAECRDICVGSLVISLSDGLGWLDNWLELALSQQQVAFSHSLEDTTIFKKKIKFASDTDFGKIDQKKCLDF